MLITISYISFAFAGIFVLLLLLYLFQHTRKKSLKVRKKIKSRRRFYSVAAFLFVLAGLTLQLMAAREASYTKRFIGSASPVDQYLSAKSARGAEKALDTLPTDLYAVGDDYYIHTGKNALYGYLEMVTTTTDSAGKEVTSTDYQKGLVAKNTKLAAGGGNFLALCSGSGALKINGAFEYLTYEKNSATFREKVLSRGCTDVAANANSLFYVTGSKLYSMGYNAFGQLGDGTERNRLTSVKVLEDAVQVSASETHTLAVDRFGNLYGFGDNSYSEMGNQTTAQSIQPVKVMTGVKQAEAGRYFSVVLAKNGDVYTAGRNQLGQLGTGDGRDHANYVKILSGVEKIAVGGSSCAALTASGQLYVWGDNSQHQLGAGEETIQTPTLLSSEVYDMAVGESSMGVISLNRDVFLTGSARAQANNEYLQPLYQFNAEIPQSALYRYTVAVPQKSEE